MIIETDRLILGPFGKDDAPRMFASWTFDENVARYCRWYPHENVETTQRLLDSYLQQQDEGFEYRWAITDKATGDLMGCIDVVGIDDDGKTADVGYAIGKKYWSKGYVTEAFRAVIQKLFDDGFTKIRAEHHIDNPASGRVMQKCGMICVGEARFPAKFGSDELCTVKIYELEK